MKDVFVIALWASLVQVSTAQTQGIGIPVNRPLNVNMMNSRNGQGMPTGIGVPPLIDSATIQGIVDAAMQNHFPTPTAASRPSNSFNSQSANSRPRSSGGRSGGGPSRLNANPVPVASSRKQANSATAAQSKSVGPGTELSSTLTAIVTQMNDLSKELQMIKSGMRKEYDNKLGLLDQQYRQVQKQMEQVKNESQSIRNITNYLLILQNTLAGAGQALTSRLFFVERDLKGFQNVAGITFSGIMSELRSIESCQTGEYTYTCNDIPAKSLNGINEVSSTTVASAVINGTNSTDGADDGNSTNVNATMVNDSALDANGSSPVDRKQCFPLEDAVKFSDSFRSTPNVMQALSALEAASGENTNINIEVFNVTRHGFRLLVENSNVNSTGKLTVRWIACPRKVIKRVKSQRPNRNKSKMFKKQLLKAASSNSTLNETIDGMSSNESSSAIASSNKSDNAAAASSPPRSVRKPSFQRRLSLPVSFVRPKKIHSQQLPSRASAATSIQVSQRSLPVSNVRKSVSSDQTVSGIRIPSSPNVAAKAVGKLK